MKKIILFSLLPFLFSCINQKRDAIYKNEYCQIATQISDLEVNYNENDSNSFLITDSVDNLNDVLKEQILKKNIKDINKKCLERNGFMLYTIDNISILEWSTFEGTNFPRVTNVLFINGKSYDITPLFDLRIESFKKYKDGYILIGSIKCGNLCITNKTISFKIINNTIILNSFVDETSKKKEIVFNYYLNIEIKNNLSFKVKKDSIVCPLLNKDKTKVIGEKMYYIDTVSNIN